MSRSTISGFAEKGSAYDNLDSEEVMNILGGKGFSTKPHKKKDESADGDTEEARVREGILIKISNVLSHERETILAGFTALGIVLEEDVLEPTFVSRSKSKNKLGGTPHFLTHD